MQRADFKLREITAKTNNVAQRLYSVLTACNMIQGFKNEDSD